MMKILHVSKYYAPFQGGTEQIARECVHALAGQSEQRVICFQHSGGDQTDVVDGVPVVRCGCQAKIRSQSLSWSYGRQLKKLMNEFVPDVVVFHYPNPFAAHFLLRSLPAGVKLVIYWHLDIVKQKFLRRFFAGQNRALLRRATQVITTSRSYAQGSPWLGQAQDKCRVISNCIDAQRLIMTDTVRARAEAIRQQHKGKIICLTVGRHSEYKGLSYLIRAGKLLDDRFQFIITGQGEQTRQLRREAGTDARFLFTGLVDDDQLKAYLAAADIFCFPSITRNESFGVALAEAMYFGLPAVTFTIPDSGVNEVCPNGVAGLEVPNRDVQAYARALQTLAEDEALRQRLGEAGRSRVKEHYMNDRFRQSIVALMEEIGRGDGRA
ncbi:MAG: glycosyltransferase [Clostridia bacterium]|nr:glycosyltransferase [Clostridia bacterium]